MGYQRGFVHLWQSYVLEFLLIGKEIRTSGGFRSNIESGQQLRLYGVSVAGIKINDKIDAFYTL